MASTTSLYFGINANIQKVSHIFYPNSAKVQYSQEFVNQISNVFLCQHPQHHQKQLVVNKDEDTVFFKRSFVLDLNSGCWCTTSENECF